MFPFDYKSAKKRVNTVASHAECYDLMKLWLLRAGFCLPDIDVIWKIADIKDVTQMKDVFTYHLRRDEGIFGKMIIVNDRDFEPVRVILEKVLMHVKFGSRFTFHADEPALFVSNRPATAWNTVYHMMIDVLSFSPEIGERFFERFFAPSSLVEGEARIAHAIASVCQVLYEWEGLYSHERVNIRKCLPMLDGDFNPLFPSMQSLFACILKFNNLPTYEREHHFSLLSFDVTKSRNPVFLFLLLQSAFGDEMNKFEGIWPALMGVNRDDFAIIERCHSGWKLCLIIISGNLQLTSHSRFASKQAIHTISTNIVDCSTIHSDIDPSDSQIPPIIQHSINQVHSISDTLSFDLRFNLYASMMSDDERGKIAYLASRVDVKPFANNIMLTLGEVDGKLKSFEVPVPCSCLFNQRLSLRLWNLPCSDAMLTLTNVIKRLPDEPIIIFTNSRSTLSHCEVMTQISDLCDEGCFKVSRHVSSVRSMREELDLHDSDSWIHVFEIDDWDCRHIERNLKKITVGFRRPHIIFFDGVKAEKEALNMHEDDKSEYHRVCLQLFKSHPFSSEVVNRMFSYQTNHDIVRVFRYDFRLSNYDDTSCFDIVPEDDISDYADEADDESSVSSDSSGDDYDRHPHIDEHNVDYDSDEHGFHNEHRLRREANLSNDPETHHPLSNEVQLRATRGQPGNLIDDFLSRRREERIVLNYIDENFRFASRPPEVPRGPRVMHQAPVTLTLPHHSRISGDDVARINVQIDQIRDAMTEINSQSGMQSESQNVDPPILPVD